VILYKTDYHLYTVFIIRSPSFFEKSFRLRKCRLIAVLSSKAMKEG